MPENGGLQVLVIEGHQQVRVEIHRALEKRGCQVVCAWDADDVKGFLATHHDPIDVAVVDLSMLGPGPELLSTLREKHPGLRILLTVPDRSDSWVPEGVTVLKRPFDPLELTSAVLRLGNCH